MRREDVAALVRPNIASLQAYSTARDDCKGSPDIFLDANESPYDTGFNRYPDPGQHALKRRISELKGLPTENIFIGNGSDEVIDLAYRIFCEPGIDNAVIISPSYGMYGTAADINGVSRRDVQLGKDFSLSAHDVLSACDSRTKLIFLCSPNNPSGNALDRAEMLKVIGGFGGVVVVDEAYIDFSSAPSLKDEIFTRPNLIVMQTFSKAWGMAGLRVGMAFADKYIADLMSRVKYPYNISSADQEHALALSGRDISGLVAETVRERERLAAALGRMRCVRRVFPSDANFLLVKFDDAAAAYDALAGCGIMVRNRSSLTGCEQCLRITVGSRAENDALIAALEEWDGVGGAPKARGKGVAGSAASPHTAPQAVLRRVIFVDRDGTIIQEPNDEQVDSLEKLQFVPGAISALKSMSALDYVMVLASNQDGLGTAAFPEADFRPAHERMLSTLAGEGVRFDDQLIDRSMPEDNAPTRKPGLGMFGKYLTGDYDLGRSFVIGDRQSDALLAQRLGARFLRIDPQRQQLSWAEAAEAVRAEERVATVIRKTSETEVYVRLDLDGKGHSMVDTGLGFFDHMLEQIPHHGGVSLALTCNGDLEVDEHHTIEDCGIALGEAIASALGSKAGIERYGFVLPMDECRAMALIDFGGRADLEWDVSFTREYVGDVPTEMFRHFFKSLSDAARCNLHISARGDNNHHLAEAVFKAFARALRQAVRRDVFNYALPSSKGTL